LNIYLKYLDIQFIYIYDCKLAKIQSSIFDLNY